MPIRIQIVTEKWNPISAAIRATTHGWASHAEFVDTDKQTTFGARFIGGVKFRPCSKDHYFRCEQFTAGGVEKAYEWAITQNGKPYDLSAVTGIAFNRNWHNDSKWFCSELVAAAFEHAGIPLLSTRPSAAMWRITPRDLLLSRSLIFLNEKGIE